MFEQLPDSCESEELRVINSNLHKLKQALAEDTTNILQQLALLTVEKVDELQSEQRPLIRKAVKERIISDIADAKSNGTSLISPLSAVWS